MKIIKMDRRFALYHQGFTHQIRSMTFSERMAVEKFFRDHYGPSSDFVQTHGISVRDYNTNWRLEKPKRSFTGGTKIYVKHERDLVMLGLKFGAKIG